MASTSESQTRPANTRHPETDTPCPRPHCVLSSSSWRQSSKPLLPDDSSEATPEPLAPTTPPPSGSSGSPADDEPGIPSAAAAAVASLSCPICCDVLLAPVVTPCGHAYCLGCFEAWRNHAGGSWPHTAPGPFAAPVLCPVCRAPLPHALTSPSARRPLAPCAALSDAVAALCPQQLRERRQRAQLDAESSSPSTHGEGSTSSGGLQQGGAHGGDWVNGGGGAGGGLSGGRWWRRLQRWVVGRWRTVLRASEQLPPLEAVLGCVLLGTYAAAWTFILLQGVRGARRRVWGFLSGGACRGGRQQGRDRSCVDGPSWWVSAHGPLHPGGSGHLQMQLTLLRVWWRAACGLGHDHAAFWRTRQAASRQGQQRGLGSWRQLLELPARLVAAGAHGSAGRYAAQAAKAGLRGAGRQGVAGAGWRADRRWAERVARGGQAAGRELSHAAGAMAAGKGTGWAARHGE